MNEYEKLKQICEQREADRADKMPTEQDAVNQMFEAFIRLKELGWNGAEYCPKDGTKFKVIEAGSTGFHDCYYDGKWPNGYYWIMGDGDLWPSRPILFKQINCFASADGVIKLDDA